MTKTNYSELTITQILTLAQGDLDQMQLAKRLARRLALDARKRVAALSDPEQRELENLELVTDRDLGGAR